MDILIPDEWLRSFLTTTASITAIADKLSLCGPSVDRVSKKGIESIYEIEVTTNRVDTASVYGIAREAHAILPRFGIKTGFNKAEAKIKQKFVKKVDYLEAKVDTALCPRFTTVLIKNVKIATSPKWVKERLEWVGVRPINNVVDISNYVMHEFGQPVHTFDYDKIKGAKMILRKSKKGEVVTTLDNQKNVLPGGDIVIEDASGRLIDLAGIMGGANSEVDESTKNVLLFVQTYDAATVRRTSMTLPKRTEAVELFEKGLDTELVNLGMARAIELFEKLTHGKVEKEILDIYPNPYKPKSVSTDLAFIEGRLGIKIDKNEITRLLTALGFETTWQKNSLKVQVPSFRASDVSIPEDVLEEIARIYGYHNLPSTIMAGKIPEKPQNSPFSFEINVKRLLKGYGACELYNLSLVSAEEKGDSTLELKNPLGEDTKYLRTSLTPTLIKATETNAGIKEPYHLFEMANVYLPKTGSLPEEKMQLTGIFNHYSYREAKGVLEALLQELHIDASFTPQDSKDFLASKRVQIKSGNILGEFGILEKGNYILYSLDMNNLRRAYKPFLPYQPIPKYPPQIEDVTLNMPQRTRVQDVISIIKAANTIIRDVTLSDTFKDAYTFRVTYLNPNKTLTDEEVRAIREKYLNRLNKLGITQKN